MQTGSVQHVMLKMLLCKCVNVMLPWLLLCCIASTLTLTFIKCDFLVTSKKNVLIHNISFSHHQIEQSLASTSCCFAVYRWLSFCLPKIADIREPKHTLCVRVHARMNEDLKNWLTIFQCGKNRRQWCHEVSSRLCRLDTAIFHAIQRRARETFLSQLRRYEKDRSDYEASQGG